jgi:hypothetical protein
VATSEKGRHDRLKGSSGLRTDLQISTHRHQSSRINKKDINPHAKTKKKHINPHASLSGNKEDFTKNPVHRSAETKIDINPHAKKTSQSEMAS